MGSHWSILCGGSSIGSDSIGVLVRRHGFGVSRGISGSVDSLLGDGHGILRGLGAMWDPGDGVDL